MEKTLLTICALVLSICSPAQESNFKFFKRNHKHHRTKVEATGTTLQFGNISLKEDNHVLSEEDLFPELQAGQLYGLLRNNFDVEVRRSSPAWMYKNYKLRKAAKSQYSLRLIPFEERLSYINAKKRKPFFVGN